MKRFFNIFLSFVIIALIMFLPACSDDNNDNDSNSNANEDYYLAIGYHSITFDKYSTIIYENTENNLVVINDNKIMLPHNAKFSISFNLEKNTDFELNNLNIVNFKLGKNLSGFTDGTKIYDIHNNQITLKNNLTISAIFEDFKTLGVAIFPIISDDETSIPTFSGIFDELDTLDKNLLLFYSKDASYESFATNNSQIIAKTSYTITATLLQNNTFELNICLETYFDTISIDAFLILKDNSNNYFFYHKPFDDDFINTPLLFNNLSNPNSNINKITLYLSFDLSTTDDGI